MGMKNGQKPRPQRVLHSGKRKSVTIRRRTVACTRRKPAEAEVPDSRKAAGPPRAGPREIRLRSGAVRLRKRTISERLPPTPARRSGFVQRRRWCRPQGRQLRRHAVESTVRQFPRAAEWGSPRLRIHAGTAVRLGSPSAGARPGAAFPAADHTCRDTGQRIGDGRRATNSGDPERRGRPGSERRPATKFDCAAGRVFHGNGQSVPDASILDSGIRIVRRQPRLLERRRVRRFPRRAAVRPVPAGRRRQRFGAEQIRRPAVPAQDRRRA